MTPEPIHPLAAAPLEGSGPSRATEPGSSALSGLLHPVRRLRAKLQAWFVARLPPSDSVTLSQRTVYILPTGPGWMLGLTLLVLLVASINYQLNLGYLLTFLLAGTALAGMHVCHATLRGLAMNLMALSAHYAGANATFDIKLTNNRRSARHAIGLSVLAPGDAPAPKGSPRHWVWTDVPAQGASVVQVAFTPARRGLHRLPALTAETRFPLGTFRVWTVWRPAAQMMVYPAPELHPPPLPPGEPRAQGSDSAARMQGSGEFDGVRGYRRGDSMKNVLWKKAAKAGDSGAGLVVRDTAPVQRQELWLDFRHSGTPEREQQLSRLCAWVLQADRLGLSYGLRLPGLDLAPGHGAAHQRRCLEALATC